MFGDWENSGFNKTCETFVVEGNTIVVLGIYKVESINISLGIINQQCNKLIKVFSWIGLVFLRTEAEGTEGKKKGMGQN